MEKKCIGIDVGGTTVKIGLFETDGTLVYKWEVPSRKEENGAYILPDVAASIRKKLNERGIPMDAVIGAGMGFPGPGAAGRLCGGLRQLRMARSEPAEDFE